MIPVSLFAHCTLTSATSELAASNSRTESERTRPKASRSAQSVRTPSSRSSALAKSRTPTCSTLLVMIAPGSRFRAPPTRPWASSTPRIARSSASVPEPQSVICRVLAPISMASCLRASSIRCRAAWPGRWTLDGLCQCSPSICDIASHTGSSGRVVALLSR